jgi:hypothetical protein
MRPPPPQTVYFPDLDQTLFDQPLVSAADLCQSKKQAEWFYTGIGLVYQLLVSAAWISVSLRSRLNGLTVGLGLSISLLSQQLGSQSV